MKCVDIWTDGACSGNPGRGGWAAVLKYGKHTKELSGFDADTTNNRMELAAVIFALSALREPCCVKLHSDSAYVCNAFEKQWLRRWKANGWMTSGKKPVLNRDLWEALLELTDKHQIEWVKVRGHADDDNNNLCDRLARSQITENSPKKPTVPTAESE